MVHYHIIVHGYVQGVGFRYFVQKTASLYGINGWVRNCYDDTVEMDVEGSELNLEQFIKAVEKGNRFSKIDRVEIEEIKNMENYRSFKIKEYY